MARKIVAEFDAIDGPFINKLRAIDQSIGRFETGTLSAFGRVEKGMNSLVRTAGDFRNISGLIASGLGVNLATDFIDQATRIRRALNEAGASGQEDFEKLFHAANRSLASMDNFAQAVQRMHKSMDGRQSFDQTLRDMETLNKLLILGGKTTQERMSTMIQFGQALQSGVLQGEELRSLRENAPIELMRAIAAEAGGTIEDLKKLGEQGKLTTDVMIAALQSLEKEADARMGNVTATISEAAVILRNGAIVATEGFDKGLGLSRATVAGLTTLGELLGKSQQTFELWSWAVGEATSYAEAFGQAVLVTGGAMAVSFAGRKMNAGLAAVQAYAPALKQAAEAAQKEQVATRLAANAARDNYNKRRAAMDGVLRLQDQMVSAARTGAVEEAKAATAARHAAEIRAQDAAANLAMMQRQIAATEKQIASETRLRQLGFRGQDQRELYGDAAYTRRIGGMNEDQFAALLRQREDLQAKLAALDAQRIAAERAVTTAVGAEAAKRAQLDMAGLNAVVQYDKQTKTKRAALSRQLAAAELALATAMERQAVAANAAAAANARLSLSGRAVAAAGAMMHGAWAFLGGWPGLILLAGTAFLVLSSNMETAAQRLDRLTSDTGDATGAADALRDVQNRLGEAMEIAGNKGVAASGKIVAATKQEYEAKRKLLELEMRSLAQTQFERVNEMTQLRDRQNAIAERRKKAEAVLQGDRSATDADSVLFRNMPQSRLTQEIAEFREAEAQADALVTELRANIALTGGVIAENNALLAKSFGDLGASADGVTGSIGGMGNASSEAVAKFNELMAVKQGEIELQRLINQYGEESAEVAAYRADAERAAYEETAKAAGVTGELLTQLMAAYDEAVALSQVDVGAGLAGGVANAAAIAQNLGIAYGAAVALQGVWSRTQAGDDGRGSQRETVRGANTRTPEQPWLKSYTRGGWISKGSAGGSGGSGGASQESKDQEEALRFIEEMMTAEEKRAQKLREMKTLREQLVQTYGAEAEIVGRMDEAIARFTDGLEDASSKVQEVFDIMSDNIASAIEDWKGFGHLVKSILADIVRQHGVAFFTALLTPGRQSGDDLGTWLGNAMTGQLHSGGGAGNRNARSVPASAFIGAPRFHNGLMPDEFTAILQKGETVLPKGVSPLGPSVSISMPVDLRGADPSMVPYIDAKMAELKREFPGRVLTAINTLKTTRKI